MVRSSLTLFDRKGLTGRRCRREILRSRRHRLLAHRHDCAIIAPRALLRLSCNIRRSSRHGCPYSAHIAKFAPANSWPYVVGAETEPTLFRVGGVSYLRIPADDPRRSGHFYEAVFGWKMRGDPDEPSFEDGSGHVIGHSWRTCRSQARRGCDRTSLSSMSTRRLTRSWLTAARWGRRRIRKATRG